MKPGIALAAFGGENWIGGMYYIRNMAFQLAMNEKVREKYSLYIITQADMKKVYDQLPESIQILTSAKGRIGKLQSLALLKKYNIKYFFPFRRNLDFMKVNSVAWIPDFQHNHLPDMFTQEELAQRTAEYQGIASSPNALVLSSHSSLADFRAFYSADKENVTVVPFVSYIEPFIKAITSEQEREILDKFDVTNKKYVCVMNQFWKHKNHKVVFQAMKLFYEKHPDSELEFLFTGKLADYRNPEYIAQLKTMMADPQIADHIKMLGFIEREEQLVIMKNAQFVLQPSLFEGWGTVLEDAKVLDKTVLLSDIPVHREQMTDKCFLFDPRDAGQLAALIERESAVTHNDCVEKGIADMYVRAREYSKGFEKILDL